MSKVTHVRTREMADAFDGHKKRRDTVVRLMHEMRAHASDLGAATIAERIGTDLVDKLESDRFNLVVVGEFNHGKTSFVNALLGKAVLPVGVTPTTAVIHHVQHGEENAELVRDNDQRTPVPLTELANFAAGNEARQDDVVRIEVDYPAPLLSERIVLVDTPGVNDLCLQRADITYEYIPRADAVLFVIDAGQPLKESERLFLRDKLLGQSRDKIIFVVAKADIWSGEERDEALGYIRAELGKLVDAPTVFAVSAQKSLAGEADAGMRELVAHLTAYLAEERGRIVLDNALGESLEVSHALARGIDARRRAALMTSVEIDRRIAGIEADLAGQRATLDERRAAIREELAGIRAWVKRDVERFCDDVARQLPGMVEQASVDDLKQHLSGFLEATLVDWAQKETAEVAGALEALAEKTVVLMRDSAHESAKRLSSGVGGDVTAPDVSVDTFGYDLGVAALFTVGLGMVFTNVMLGVLMAGAAPVLAYYAKGQIDAKTRDKACEQAELALREAAAKVAPKLDDMVREFGQRLDAWVDSAGKEVHQQMIDVLMAAKRESGENAPDVAKAERQCDLWADALKELAQRIDGERESLWA